MEKDTHTEMSRSTPNHSTLETYSLSNERFSFSFHDIREDETGLNGIQRDDD